jgi:hypothetical protein
MPLGSPSSNNAALDLPTAFLAQRMHSIWLKNFRQTHGPQATRYKPVPDPDLQGWSMVRFRGTQQGKDTPEQMTHLMSEGGETKDVRHLHLYDCQLVEKEGVSFVVQNIAQPPKWINPSLMHQLNGRLAREYLEAALPLCGEATLDRTQKAREGLADRLHDIWVRANKDWAPKEQLVKYADLPLHEKEKDLLLADVVMQTAWEARELLDPDMPDQAASLDV